MNTSLVFDVLRFLGFLVHAGGREGMACLLPAARLICPLFRDTFSSSPATPATLVGVTNGPSKAAAPQYLLVRPVVEAQRALCWNGGTVAA